MLSWQYIFHFNVVCCFVSSVLWRCWLGGRNGIQPVKNWVVGCWRGICLERGADPHVAQLMPLPLTVSCFCKIQIGFTFLVPAYPGSPGQRAVKQVCVCCVLICYRTHRTSQNYHLVIQDYPSFTKQSTVCTKPALQEQDRAQSISHIIHTQSVGIHNVCHDTGQHINYGSFFQLALKNGEHSQ